MQFFTIFQRISVIQIFSLNHITSFFVIEPFQADFDTTILQFPVWCGSIQAPFCGLFSRQNMHQIFNLELKSETLTNGELNNVETIVGIGTGCILNKPEDVWLEGTVGRRMCQLGQLPKY